MKRIVVGILVTAGTVTGCGAQSSPNSVNTVTSAPAPTPNESGSEMEITPSQIAQAVAKEVIGMSESDAIQTIESAKGEKLTARVVRRDEESYVVTMDYRLDRINLEFDDGRVTKATIG